MTLQCQPSNHLFASNSERRTIDGIQWIGCRRCTYWRVESVRPALSKVLAMQPRIDTSLPMQKRGATGLYLVQAAVIAMAVEAILLYVAFGGIQ